MSTYLQISLFSYRFIDSLFTFAFALRKSRDVIHDVACDRYRTVNSVNIHDIGTLWNNTFRHIFNCCWRESVKPLQYFCQALPLSYLIDERRLVFFRKLLVHDNIVIRTLVALPAVYYD